jgi:hypothetical protein
MANSLYQKADKEVRETTARLPGVVPAHRLAFRGGYSFSNLPYNEQLLIWDYIWKASNDFWARVHALFFSEKMVMKKEYSSLLWDSTRSWQEDVTNWGLCDGLAKIYTKLLEDLPNEVYAQLQAWNKDSDLWKRRQSIVSLLYFSRTKKKYPSPAQIEALIVPLLGDKEYYVQKGVGWCLREYHTVYPRQGKAFLTTHIEKISPIAFTISLEKLSREEKDLLKLKRSGRKTDKRTGS